MFAEVIGKKQPQVSRLANNARQPTPAVLKSITTKLGYNADWILNGIGPKKKKEQEKATLLTEVRDLKQTINIMQVQLNRMEARMKAYEQEVAELKGERS